MYTFLQLNPGKMLRTISAIKAARPECFLPTLTRCFLSTSKKAASEEITKSYIEIFEGTKSEPVNVNAGVFAIPKYGKAEKGVIRMPNDCGDDSYNIFESKTIAALTVADGVGGLKWQGQDPATFARTLMRKTGEVLEESCEMAPKVVLDLTPKGVLGAAFDRLIKDFKAKVDERLSSGGASTAVSVFIDKTTGKLKSANVGDSCFIVFSKNKSGKWNVKFQSEPEEFFDNCPYQYNVNPEGEIREKIIKITELECQLSKGDVVLVMSDGVYDNMYEGDMAAIISQTLVTENKDNEAAILAEQIAFGALKFSKLKKRKDPYNETKFNEYGEPLNRGAKHDDITVIAAIIN